MSHLTPCPTEHRVPLNPCIHLHTALIPWKKAHLPSPPPAPPLCSGASSEKSGLKLKAPLYPFHPSKFKKTGWWCFRDRVKLALPYCALQPGLGALRRLRQLGRVVEEQVDPSETRTLKGDVLSTG